MVEDLITYFFIAELAIRIWTYLAVHGELDSFLFDFLNLMDIIVVAIDLIIIVGSTEPPVWTEGIEAASNSETADGGNGSEGQGLVKALRSARGVRLLRVLRAARALRLLKRKKKMTQEEAVNDPRSNRVSFPELCKRMLRYADRNCENPFKHHVVHISLQILCQHLEKR